MVAPGLATLPQCPRISVIGTVEFVLQSELVACGVHVMDCGLKLIRPIPYTYQHVCITWTHPVKSGSTFL